MLYIKPFPSKCVVNVKHLDNPHGVAKVFTIWLHITRDNTSLLCCATDTTTDQYVPNFSKHSIHNIQMKGSSKPLLCVDITIKYATSRSDFDSECLPGSHFMLWPQHHCTGSPGLSVPMLSTKVLILTWQACHLTSPTFPWGKQTTVFLYFTTVLTTVFLYYNCTDYMLIEQWPGCYAIGDGAARFPLRKWTTVFLCRTQL